MRLRINKSKANGNISAPPSKSMAHRYIICAALADGVSRISNVDYSEDIKATIDCIKTLGAKVDINEDIVTIDGSNTIFNMSPKTDTSNDSSASFEHIEEDELIFKCRESGSTMRFFMGIAMILARKSRFFGSETLRNRPFGIYEEILRSEKLDLERDKDSILIVGGIKKDIYEIPGDISSQFVTGLLLALSLRKEGGKVVLTGHIESRSYINMTIQAMNDFGINVQWDNDNTIKIKDSERYRVRDIRVEGDYSNSAFLDAFNFIGGNVTVNDLNERSLQGDRVYKECFEKLSKEKALIDIADCPDLGPVLFSIAAANHGGHFTSTARLKIKESDRGRVMCEELAKFGVNTHMEDNFIDIENGGIKTPDEMILGHNDHRIVMSLTLLLTLTGGVIDDAQAVRKSYPGFFDDIQKLGISIEEIE